MLRTNNISNCYAKKLNWLENVLFRMFLLGIRKNAETVNDVSRLNVANRSKLQTPLSQK